MFILRTSQRQNNQTGDKTTRNTLTFEKITGIKRNTFLKANFPKPKISNRGCNVFTGMPDMKIDNIPSREEFTYERDENGFEINPVDPGVIVSGLILNERPKFGLSGWVNITFSCGKTSYLYAEEKYGRNGFFSFS